MATTTNFGWETPDDTDLVKDGALSMRTLGNSIDTSFVDLKGGATGQNLRKNSNTDLDFTWAGDATNTVIDAQGDLLYGTAADTLGRIAIGTTGQVLTVAGGIPSWATPASSTPSFVGCTLHNTTNTTVSNNTATTLLFDSEYIDTDGFHSTTSNTGRITIPTGKGGKYLFVMQSYFDTNLSGFRRVELFKNGALVEKAQYTHTSSGYMSINQSYIVSAVAADYFTMVVTQDSGGNLTNYQVGTFFQCQYLGA
jgi:hypothetical protein